VEEGIKFVDKNFDKVFPLIGSVPKLKSLTNSIKWFLLKGRSIGCSTIPEKLIEKIFLDRCI
jgi:hypothetical protein